MKRHEIHEKGLSKKQRNKAEKYIGCTKGEKVCLLMSPGVKRM